MKCIIKTVPSTVLQSPGIEIAEFNLIFYANWVRLLVLADLKSYNLVKNKQPLYNESIKKRLMKNKA